MKLSSSLHFISIVMGALALGSAGVFAADAPKTRDERGMIKSVDATAHTLVISDLKNRSEHKFQWNDQTKFTEHGKTATAAALKGGERVRITCSGTGDLLTMQRVQIAPAKAGKPVAEKS